MIIELNNVSKRYTDHWVIKNLSVSFHAGTIYGIAGDNGSGKSTLLKMLSGFLSSSQGRISYTHDGDEVDRDDIYKMVSFSAPYISVLRQLTILEMIQLAARHKSWLTGYSSSDVIRKMDLPVSDNVYIKTLSSGQLQRVNLTIAMLQDTHIVLLDEPTSYLDRKSKGWFVELMEETKADRLVVIASNDDEDLALTHKLVRLEE